MKQAALKLTVLFLALVSLQSQASPVKMHLQNDILVGSKVYVRFDDIESSGYPGTLDDEGYCIIDDSFFNGNNSFDQFKKSRLLKAGTELAVIGSGSRERKNWKGETVIDQFTLVQSSRGQLKLACSIDRSASETNGYKLELQEELYLRALGIQVTH